MTSPIAQRQGVSIELSPVIKAGPKTSMNPLMRAVKRTMDVVISLLVLGVLLPLMVILAVLIRFDTPGPALFISERIGKDRKPFKMVKFRTMIDGAHLTYEEIRKANIHAVNGVLFKDEKDLRITRFGRFLRISSLDELPQLWNVLTGTMSLVGPRPAFEVELAELEERALARFSVTPGMTGLWQVSGRSLLPHEKAIELDLYYATHQSLWLDLKILAKTVPAVLKRTGAL